MIVAEVVPWPAVIPEPGVCRDRLATLTAGERHVLEMMAVGWSPKQIAYTRGSARKTVQRQVLLACNKLDVSGHVQALAVLRRAELAT